MLMEMPLLLLRVSLDSRKLGDVNSYVPHRTPPSVCDIDGYVYVAVQPTTT